MMEDFHVQQQRYSGGDDFIPTSLFILPNIVRVYDSKGNIASKHSYQ